MKNLLALLICLTAISVSAQNKEEPSPKQPEKTDFILGMGLGLDYGGIGMQFNYVPQKNIALFGGIGFAIIGLGYNVGGKFRMSPKTKACPYLSAMYGYNAVIKVKGADQYDQFYYGPSFGFGCELWNRERKGCFNIELLVPVRSEEFDKDWNALKKNPQIEIKQDILPIAFTLGYNFKL